MFSFYKKLSERDLNKQSRIPNTSNARRQQKRVRILYFRLLLISAANVNIKSNSYHLSVAKALLTIIDFSFFLREPAVHKPIVATAAVDLQRGMQCCINPPGGICLRLLLLHILGGRLNRVYFAQYPCFVDYACI